MTSACAPAEPRKLACRGVALPHHRLQLLLRLGGAAGAPGVARQTAGHRPGHGRDDGLHRRQH